MPVARASMNHRGQGHVYCFIQRVVIKWRVGSVYDHFLNENVYACGHKYLHPINPSDINVKKWVGSS